MGVKIEQYYEKANKLGGVKAKCRMAMLTCIGSVLAHDTPDTPDVLVKFEKALKKLEEELGGK